MASLISAFRVVLLLWISLSIHSVQSTTIKLSDMSLVSDVINYVKPLIQSLQLGPASFYQRAVPAATPEIAIEEKVTELRPYLQDDERDKVEPGEEETTIIEFSPRDTILNGIRQNAETEPFQANLRKYKNMRNKIKLALERETVSAQTKQIVTKTLDELIATLVQTQCPQSLLQNFQNKLPTYRTNLFQDFVPNITYDSNKNCYFNRVKLDDDQCRKLKEPFKHCQILGKKISEEECRKLTQFAMIHFPCYLGDKKYSAETCKNLAKNITNSTPMTTESFQEYIKKLLPSKDSQIDFYNSFNRAVSNVLYDFNKVPEKYKVRCTLVGKENAKKSARNSDVCRDFRVCSEELTQFLTIFYKSLNDTAVRAFRTYAAMYEKDIIADVSEEKTAVLTTIKHASDILEERVSNAFIKTTGEMTLDENKDKDMNIAALREYVKYTIKTLNKTVSKHLEADLSVLRARLLVAIKQDLAHNLASELGHVESDVIKQMCSFFVTCQSNLAKPSDSTYLFRKQFAVPKTKSNSVFVNLELALDDDFKNKLMKKHKAIAQDRLHNVIAVRSQNDQKDVKKVTRTTRRPTDEAVPTTLINMPISIENSDSSENDEETNNGLKMSKK